MITFDIKTGEFKDLEELDKQAKEELRGEKGDKGDTGEQGLKGDKGDKGDAGEQGLKGDKGERGEKGDTGENGKDGRDGVDGKDGKDGKDGQVIYSAQSGGGRMRLKDLEGMLEAGNDISLTTANKKIVIASTGGGYTDEQAQDAVGTILVDSAEIDFTYNDATPSITASIVAGSIDETKLDASVNASLDLADSALQGNQTITLSGDVSGSGATSITTTLATVNANVGSFGSSTAVGTFTVNAKGLLTAAGNTTVTPAASSITGAAALTRTDDTNVTLTLGGTPTTALLQATSLTVGWSGTLAVSRGGSGAGTLTGLLLGNGTSAFTAITNSSTVGQCLRVTGASTYAWGALDLADTDAITGRLPFANLTQGSALSVLGVTGNATANVASIAAGTDNQVLRRSGTALTFGAVNLASANAVTGDLPYANLTPSGAASRLLGRGSSGGAGDWQEISLSGLSMIGTTLTYVAPDVSDYVHNPAETSTDNALTRFNGTDGVNIQNSGVILSDTDAMTGLASLTFDLGTDVNEFSTDGLLAGDSDDAVPTEKATKTYIDARALYKAPVSGRYYANHSTAMFPGTASVFGATGWVFFSAHNLSFPTTIGKVSFEVTTAVAASNGRVGIYSDVNGVPTTLLRDCGTISTATTGVKEITGLAQAVAAGRFWIGTQFESAISVRSWGTAVGHEINAEIGMAAFNNPVTVNLDLTTTYAGGLPATATVSQFNGVDTIQTCWRS